MRIECEKDTLIKYVGNGKVILLNPNNKHWIRLSETLFEKKMLNSAHFFNELNEKYQMFEAPNKFNGVDAIYYSVTGKCNLRCKFCALNSGPDVDTDNDLTIKQIAKIASEIKKLNVRKVVITGGEPLVRHDIREIVRLFAESIGKDKITLQTNGILLDNQILSEIAPFINNLEISIENIFSNNVLLNNMRKIFHASLKYNIKLSFSFVVDRDSMPYFIDALKLSQEFNAHFQYRIVSAIGRAIENSLSLSEKEILSIYITFLDYVINTPDKSEPFMEYLLGNLYPQRSCGAYGRILAIHPDGETFMCANFFDKEFALGNVKFDELNVILNRLACKLHDEKIKKVFLVDHNSKCQKCNYIYFCNGQCVAESIQNEEDYNCDLKKKLLEFSMFYIDNKKSKLDNIYNMREYLIALSKEV